MPSSVTAMLAVADLTHLETARWGVRPTFDGAGVHLVALAEHPDICDGLASAPLARQRVRQLLDVRPELTVDGERPDVEQLLARLAKLWLSEETILYIGRASASVSNRVMAYYNPPLGASAPPAGGWPIKTLGGLSNIYVHVAATADPARADEAMIDAFVSGVIALDRRSVVDPDLPLPFANLEDGRHRRKRHGIRGARKPYARKLSLATLPPAPRDDAAGNPRRCRRRDHAARSGRRGDAERHGEAPRARLHPRHQLREAAAQPAATSERDPDTSTGPADDVCVGCAPRPGQGAIRVASRGARAPHRGRA
jgi:hypothetical protein